MKQPPRPERHVVSGADFELDSPLAVERRLALAVTMLDAAVLELRDLMSHLQTVTTVDSKGMTTTTTTTEIDRPEGTQQ